MPAIEIANAWVSLRPSFQGAQGAITSELAGLDTSRAGTAMGTSLGGNIATGLGGVMRGVGTIALAGAATAVAAGAGVVGVALSRGLDRALNLQDARAKLTGLGHDTEAVGAIMENATASVRGTAFGLDAAATTAAGAVAAGIAPGEALTRTLTLTADAATIAGTSMGEMGSIINKVATSGKLSTDVLNQFHDRGVPLLQMVADEYGVTTEAAQEMVTKGQVSFERFQSALETNVAGAALESGNTARGAWANVGAALGRLGAMFTGGAVAGAPGLFQSMSAAIDRAGVALTPLAEAFNARLEPAMAGLSGWIDTLDFGKVVSGAQGLYNLIVGGDFTGALRDAFGWEEDSGFVTFVLNARDAVSGLYNLVVGGDFTGALRNAFGWEEDSGFVTFILGARTAIGDFFSTLSSGDVGGSFASIGTSMQALAPAFAEFGAQLPAISGAAGQLAGAGLTVLTGALSFLASNVDTIIALMPLIVAGFVAWRVASTANASAQSALTAAQLAALPVTTANAIMRRQAAMAELAMMNAQRASTATQVANTAATNGGILANIRAGAATVGARIAMVAGTIATGAATAAQWALNAAMSANPIALIVIAIAALVAGLIWFFTQTELGQQIWANFTQFLGEAWANVSAWFMSVGEGIATWWTGLWQGISDFFSGIWNGIVTFITTYVATMMAIYTGLGVAISTWWNGLWQGVSDFFSGIWNGVVTAVSTGIENVVGFITGIPDRVMAVLSGIGNLLVDSGASLIQGFIDGITGMLDNVGNAIGGVMDFIGGFFPNSPAKRGPLSGSGWRRISSGGRATMDEFLGGMVMGGDQASRALGSVVDAFWSDPSALQPRALGELNAAATGGAGGADSIDLDRLADMLWQRDRTAARTIGQVARGYTDESMAGVVRR